MVQQLEQGTGSTASDTPTPITRPGITTTASSGPHMVQHLEQEAQRVITRPNDQSQDLKSE